MPLQTKKLQKWFGWVVSLAMVGSVLAWFMTGDNRPIRIATSDSSNLYFELVSASKPHLARRTGRDIVVLETSGSGENRRRLLDREADFALIQGDLLSEDDVGRIALIAPLFPEVVYVAVRPEHDVKTIYELENRKVYLGPKSSGSRFTAERLLAHFDVQVTEADPKLADLADALANPDVDCAIVTTSIHNITLRRALQNGRFELVPIPQAKGLAARTALLRDFEIPTGLFGGRPLVPAAQTPTLATTAFLAARTDISDQLVSQVLPAFFEDGLNFAYPSLIRREDAPNWSPVSMHATARGYFNPVDRIDWVASVMESLAATKELLFALGAGIYLLRVRWRRLEERESEDAIQMRKDRLDQFLEQTLRIEKNQMATTDPVDLQKYLDQVTTIKLAALQEFTEEELRADHSFSIFLMQCANLISKIQLKMVAGSKV